MSDHIIRRRGRPPKAGRHVENDWEDLVRMVPLIDGDQRLRPMTAAKEVVRDKPIREDEKRAAADRLRKRWTEESAAARAEAKQRQPITVDASALPAWHGQTRASSPMIAIKANQKAAKEILQNGGRDAVIARKKVKAALSGQDSKADYETIRHSVRNARAAREILSSLRRAVSKN